MNGYQWEELIEKYLLKLIFDKKHNTEELTNKTFLLLNNFIFKFRFAIYLIQYQLTLCTHKY